MVTRDSSDIPAALSMPLSDPAFYPSLFSLVAHSPKGGGTHADQVRELLLDDYDGLSQQLDRIELQQSTTVRNVLTTRRLAMLLINDDGEMQMPLLQVAEETLQKALYSLGPKRSYDSIRHRHLLKVIRRLRQDKDLRLLLRAVSKPQGHRLAEQVVRDTLQLAADEVLTDTHARRAALSAWMCFLRQNVGSCFATAPAIIIHDEQPHLFLKDITELLATGRLKKVFGGIEYSVPLSSTWGAGDLRRLLPVFRQGDRGLSIDFSQSPGLLAALNAVDVGSEGPSAGARLTEAADELLEDKPYVFLSPEALIRQVLLRHYELTEQDVQDYEHRPKPMVHSSLMMQSSTVSSTGKGGRSARLLADFERACNAFKALTDNALLRSWEFTVASFSETKADFATWNLYSSLGLRAEEPGGIGEQLYVIVKHKLDRANEKVHDFQNEYEQLFGQLKYLETRLRAASSESEARWLKADYETKRNEFYTFEEMRNTAVKKAQRYANLYPTLIDTYIKLFPDYFQEVYDADLHEVDVGPYDDSPAGFRLLFKHGRSNTSLWTLIKSPLQFIEALAAFFTLSESRVAEMAEVEGLEQDFGEITTAIVSHVRSDAFLESALYRMAAAHRTPLIRDPLKHLDKVEKKPWAYTSGGTMDTLVSVYYRRDEKPTELTRWMESEVELLVFLLDSVKRIPQKLVDEYLEDPSRSLLMNSPTHAFLLKPGLSPFREGVRDNTYTYIWARDQVVQPMQRFVEALFLDREMMEQLFDLLEEQVPLNYRPQFRSAFRDVPGKLKATEFRGYVLDELNRYRTLQIGGQAALTEEQIDSLLYASLPMSHGYQVRSRVEKLLEAMPEMNGRRLEKLMRLYDSTTSASVAASPMPANRLQDMVKALLLLEKRSSRSTYDYPYLVALAAQKLGFAMPTPVLFADTNWVTDLFGFVVSPSSGKLELWRLDYTGSVGAPLSNWKQWLDGSRQDRTWAVYIQPTQYRM